MTKVTTYPANERVIAIAANATPVEWPVSGDESVRAHGYIGLRRARDSVSLWDFPGIKPKVKTTGIRVGDTIETWSYTGVVTRVGSIAGFYMVAGKELRWTIESVIEIRPANG